MEELSYLTAIAAHNAAGNQGASVHGIVGGVLGSIYSAVCLRLPSFEKPPLWPVFKVKDFWGGRLP